MIWESLLFILSLLFHFPAAEKKVQPGPAPFGQVDSQLARKFEGTGLGLPLSNALAQLHDGALELQSTPGKGTTVTVRLPAGRVVSEPTT